MGSEPNNTKEGLVLWLRLAGTLLTVPVIQEPHTTKDILREWGSRARDVVEIVALGVRIAYKEAKTKRLTASNRLLEKELLPKLMKWEAQQGFAPKEGETLDERFERFAKFVEAKSTKGGTAVKSPTPQGPG
ncbi:MAG: hypothetical protein WCD70_05580 [Alphaproteobacteria bacterium]